MGSNKKSKHPYLVEIIVIISAFVLTLVFSVVSQMLGFSDNEFSIAVGRIVTGLILLVIFSRCFRLRNQFTGLLIAIPALLFPAWNIANHYFTNGEYAAPSLEILILGLAPAIFEEVLFRGIFITKLKESGKSNAAAVIISAVVFGLIHLTNAVGQDLAQVVLQVGYAFVVGLVFGAIYARSGDLLSVIIIHAAIDITNRVYMANSGATTQAVIMFVALLVIEAAYGFFLIRKSPKAQKAAAAEE